MCDVCLFSVCIFKRYSFRRSANKKGSSDFPLLPFPVNHELPRPFIGCFQNLSGGSVKIFPRPGVEIITPVSFSGRAGVSAADIFQGRIGKLLWKLFIYILIVLICHDSSSCLAIPHGSLSLFDGLYMNTNGGCKMLRFPAFLFQQQTYRQIQCTTDSLFPQKQNKFCNIWGVCCVCKLRTQTEATASFLNIY